LRVPFTVTLTVCSPVDRTGERYTSTFSWRVAEYWSIVVVAPPSI
jgi:hypothetical protein